MIYLKLERPEISSQDAVTYRSHNYNFSKSGYFRLAKIQIDSWPALSGSNRTQTHSQKHGYLTIWQLQI